MNPYAGSMRRGCAILIAAVALVEGRRLPAADRPAPGKPGPPTTDTEIPIRCGRIVGVRITDKPVLWRDLDKVLAAGRFRPSETDDESTLTRRPPATGRVYVVIDVKLAEGRSIGKYDWKLAFGDEVAPCLALARDRLPFDARNWEYRYDNGLAVLHLLFEAPEGLEAASLVPALPLTLSEPAVRLDLIGGTGKTESAQPREKTAAGKEAAKAVDKKAAAGSKPTPKPKAKSQVTTGNRPAPKTKKTVTKPRPPAPTGPKKKEKPKPGKKPKAPPPKPAVDDDWM